MALKPEARAEWILARLEEDEFTAVSELAGASEVDRTELARDSADCRQMWLALDELNEGIESETASPGARSAFQAHLRDAIDRQRASAPGRSGGVAIFGRRPRFAFVCLAAGAALMVIAALALWRPAPWSPRGHRENGETLGSVGQASRSASSRLDAVLAPSGGNKFSTASNLGRVLVSDPNPNVRLAALDVLTERFAEAGLEGRVAGALAIESDPLVRLELIRTIGEHHLVQDGVILRELALDPSLDDVAREEIARVLARLGS